MMLFVWFCVIASTMSPGGEKIARHYVSAVEDQYRAMIETRNVIADQIADLRNAPKAA